MQHIEFPSGAVLLVCRTREKLEELRAALLKIKEIQLKTEVKSAFSFRVHYVPIDTTETEFEADFRRRFPEGEAQIKFVSYWSPKPGSRQENAKIAFCEVSEELFKLAETVRSIRVGWNSCPLDTKPYVNRCSRCGLLGHNQAHCQPPTTSTGDTGDSQTVSSLPELPDNACRDCAKYNAGIIAAKLSKNRLRSTDHATGAPMCPTYRRLLGKKLPTASSSPAKATPNQPMEEGELIIS